jgi:phosphoglycerol geranylgeranyltransferase
MANIYKHILNKFSNNEKMFAVLIDTDNVSEQTLSYLISQIAEVDVDLVFVGGSLLMKNNFVDMLAEIKSKVDIPVVLFPGSGQQVNENADAVLFLSLISGRNPEYLIGQQVLSAPVIRSIGLESISTGYMLIDSGVQTSVSYMSNTTPIPRNKINIAVSTAIAGEMLGLKLMYLDGGSGAKMVIPTEMIRAVKDSLSVPLIIGGGLSSEQEVMNAAEAGADIVVVGNAVEKDVDALRNLVNAFKSL